MRSIWWRAGQRGDDEPVVKVARVRDRLHHADLSRPGVSRHRPYAEPESVTAAKILRLLRYPVSPTSRSCR